MDSLTFSNRLHSHVAKACHPAVGCSNLRIPAKLAPQTCQQKRQLQRRCKVAAAATEETVETEGAFGDLAEEPEEATQQAPAAAKRPESSPTEGMQYALNVLWNENSLAVGVDQVFAQDSRSPVTEFYFWPRDDAWDDCKAGIEEKPWISEKEKVELLNSLTDIINAWGEDPRPPLADVQARFPDHIFK